MWVVLRYETDEPELNVTQEWILSREICGGKTNWSHSNSWLLTPSNLSRTPPNPVITEHQVGLPMIYSSFPLVICFRHDRVYISSLVSQSVKNLPAMQETWVQFLGRKDPLEKGMTTHSSILAWRIPWTEEPGRNTVHGVAKSWTRLSDYHFH